VLLTVCVTDVGHYDIFIVTSDDDQESASKLAEILVKFCRVCFGYKLTVHPELGLGANKLDHLRSGLARSSFHFIFIDDGFSEDDLVKFGTDAALIEMIQRNDQSIVPVRSHAAIPMPRLLKMFKSLDVHKLLLGKRLCDVDVNELKESDIHQFLLGNVVKMIGKSVSNACSKTLATDRSPRLSSQHSQLLRRHYSHLIDHMDPDGGLIGNLFSARVVSHREMENIRAEKTSYDRNEYLIKLLLRKSESDILLFVEALRSTNQPHIADILCSSSAKQQPSDER